MKPRYDVLKDELSKGYGGPHRFGIKLKMPEASIFFMLVNQRNRDQAKHNVESLLCQLNDDMMTQTKGYINEAYESLEGNIRYFKLVLGQNKITRKNMIVEPYFTELPNS